jgi:DNA polymerase I-like protein with 3'-5' exonuclease and polymerase domains
MTYETQIDKYGQEWLEEIKQLEQQMRDSRAVDINPNSPRQVAHYIYDILKMEQIKGEPARSVSKGTLLRLADWHEFPRLMVIHRGLSEKYKLFKRLRDAIREEEQGVIIRPRRRQN